MTDQYGRPLANPQNMSEADAIARKYANGEIPLPNQIVQDIPDDPNNPEDSGDRYAAIIERIMKEDEERQRNPSRPY